MNDDCDRRYETTDALFGRRPERIVVAHADGLPADGEVLDLGCGQGRHALWLARRGRRVVAVDPSGVAIRTVSDAARAAGLPVATVRAGFAELADPPAPYAGVLVIGLVQMLAPEDVASLAAALRRWTAPGSLLFVVAWTDADPRHAEAAASWTPLGEGSFRAPDGRVRTFLAAGSAPARLAPGWQVLEHVEALGEWHRHGDEPPERHGRVELVARRP